MIMTTREDPMNPLRVWSLNGERFAGRTANEIPSTVKWLSALSRSNAVLPDILCLQDIRSAMIPLLTPLPHFCFVPMTNQTFWGTRQSVGICIASRWPIGESAVHHSWGDGLVRDLEGVGEDNQRNRPDEIADALILKTQNRVAVACSVHRPGDEVPLRIATHHGFWVRNGATTPQQLQSTASVCGFLAEQGRRYGGLVYAADYNPDKAGRVLDLYRQQGGRDCLPPHIATTLAPHHPVANLGIRSDCMMIWPDAAGSYRHKVEDVYVDDTPGSDHLMICGSVSKIESLRSSPGNWSQVNQ